MTMIKADKGFTIIETLVAITVLMIAIAGPLVVANQGLTGAIASKDQMIASYLAQESVEAIKNIRDNNVQLNNPIITWLNGFNVSSQCNNNSALGRCDASAIEGTQGGLQLNGPQIISGAAPIYVSPSGYYSHTYTQNSTLTRFTRFFWLSAAGIPDSPCEEGNAQNECTINVIVTWNEGTVPYQISLTSELTNAPR